MYDWLYTNVIARMMGLGLLWGFVIFILTFTFSLAVTAYVLVKLPATYFHHNHDRDFWGQRHRALRWSGIIAKNIFGAILVVLGAIMSLPGVPGQGLLTILLGVMLLDFPGKRHLERKLVCQPKVRSGIDRIRARFGKPPLILD